MIYRNMFKDDVEKAWVNAMSVNETVDEVERIIDDCITLAINEHDGRLGEIITLGNYNAPTIDFGDATELDPAVSESHLYEPVVSIVLTRNDYSDEDRNFRMKFAEQRWEKLTEKYQIAFAIRISVARTRESKYDDKRLNIDHETIGEMVVFIQKYPDELIESEKNHIAMIGDGKLVNDYDIFKVTHSNGETILEDICNVYQGYEDVIPERYQEAVESVLETIEDHLKAMP